VFFSLAPAVLPLSPTAQRGQEESPNRPMEEEASETLLLHGHGWRAAHRKGLARQSHSSPHQTLVSLTPECSFTAHEPNLLGFFSRACSLVPLRC
jgi:hypothetical protein